jgi:two-component system sensor histidine kinase/response regulator
MENSISQEVSKPVILAVDDSPANIDMVKGIFAQDYIVQAAVSGKIALEIVGKKKPDLILLDIMMPEMDGFMVCRHLKSNPDTASIPIIFVTVITETEDIIKGFNLGAVDYVTKPFKPTELLARVRTHLELKNARKKIENQNKELIEAATLREDVDHIFHHDLKNPLQVVISCPQLLLMNQNLTEKEIKYINIIRESGYRMLDMINRSLDMFKMERGVYQLNLAPVDILNVVNIIESEVDKIRKEKNIQIKTELSGRPLNQEDTFVIIGEKLLCYSMLVNLIQNAIEASPENESILISINKNESAIISIHNKGVVPEKIRDKFFAKFTTSGKITGSGLGTYSAKLIAEIQRGKINMTTSETEGTTITIQLPLYTMKSEKRPGQDNSLKI